MYDGIALSERRGQYPFFEFPRNAIGHTEAGAS
jgi:hypothetical protein